MVRRSLMLTLLLVVAACGKKKGPAPTVSEVHAARVTDISCTAPAYVVGGQPPDGSEAWCEVVNPDSTKMRQGPAIEYGENGAKKALGQYDRGKKNGYWQTWYPDGTVESQGNYDHGLKTGHWVDFHPSGAKKSEGDYRNGQQNGHWQFWWPNGQLETEGEYVDGGMDGTWTELDDGGKPVYERQYRYGRLITQKNQ